MLFHTWDFVVFFTVVYTGHLYLRHTRHANTWLLAASYYFYGSWNWWYLSLIVYSTFLDFFCVNMMDEEYEYPKKIRPGLFIAYACISGLVTLFAYLTFTSSVTTIVERIGGKAGLLSIYVASFAFVIAASKVLPKLYKSFLGICPVKERVLWLWVSIVNNIGLLAFFKYGDFFVTNINALMEMANISYQMVSPSTLFTGAWKYALPVGISFYTFQSMSYTIDFYRGQIPREKCFIRFAAFVSLFPQLVAGPIERSKNLLGQMYKPCRLTANHITEGMSLFLVGLFKKVAIADYLAIYVDRVFAAAANAPSKEVFFEQYGSLTIFMAAFAFAWQIFCDFSGYTDMARGIARMMGINLMLNFRNPYLATGLSDFWGRWHISLSTWFKDYVYIPLGGNRKGTLLTYVFIFITMQVSGIWHGAAWTFVIWGFIHALGTMVTRELERTDFYRNRIPKVIKQLFVFAIVTVAWIFFRAESVSSAFMMIEGLFRFNLENPHFPVLALALVIAMWAFQYISESKYRKILHFPPVRIGGTIVMLTYLLLMSASGQNPFIYFAF